MIGFLIIMVTVVIMAIGAAIYFKCKENEAAKLSKQ